MKKSTKVTLLTIPICIIIGYLIRILGIIGVLIIYFLAINNLADFAIWLANKLVEKFE